MRIAFVLSVFIIICAFFLFKKKKITSKYRYLILVGVGALCVGIIVYPLLSFESEAIKVINAFYIAIKSISLGGNIEILSKIDLSNIRGWIYFIWINGLYLALPLLAASTIIAFINDLFTGYRLKRIKNKDVFIFSEMNEKSIFIAENYSNKKKCAIIFADTENVKNSKENTFKSIKLSEKINEIDFSDYSNLTIYMISEDEELNLNNTLELIDKNKNKKMKIYVVNSSKEAPAILDSTDKGMLDIEIVNETERAIFSLLDDKPIYIDSINNSISLLIAGCGHVGKEFLKDSLWCGQMINHSFKALIIDTKADEIKKTLEAEVPGILNDFDLKFINADINSIEAINSIKLVPDINYILVSMDTDRKNVETAINLRRLFIKLFNRKPSINIWVQNEYKKEQINKLVNEKASSYEINAFGSIKDMYFDKRIVDSDIEKIAQKIHLAYSNNLDNYYSSEYNKHSSRASGLHIKYKLYSVLEEKYTNDFDKNIELFKEVYNKKIEDLLAKNEHDRWNVYMRTIGYTLATIEDVKKYYPLLGKHIDNLGRRHPAIVPFEELDNVSKELQKLGINKDLKASDYDIVNMIINDFKI